jgi:hypothetical protein
MPSNLVIQRTFLPLTSVQMGRLVVNVDEPHQNYLDPIPAETPNVHEISRVDFAAVRRAATDQNLSSKLTNLISASRVTGNKTFTSATSSQYKTYLLDNAALWFAKTLEIEATRKWIENEIRSGEKVYVVVGYITMLDSRIIEGNSSASSSAGEIQAPLEASLAAVGAVIPSGAIGNVGLAGHQTRGEETWRQLTVPGEQICAVQYCKVRLKWFRSSDVRESKLEKGNRWKLYWDGGDRGEGDGPDSVEANLEDDLMLDDEEYSECSLDDYGNCYQAK